MALRLLSLVGPIHIVGGLLVFLTAFFPQIQLAMAELAGLTDANFSPFLFAVIGATIASWGVLFCAVVSQYRDYPTKRLWNAMLIAILVWAPLDTGLCLYYGVYGGAALNSVVIVVLIALLFAVRSKGRST